MRRTPETTQVSMRLPSALVRALDARAIELETTRTQLVARLLHECITGATQVKPIVNPDETHLKPKCNTEPASEPLGGALAQLADAVQQLTAQLALAQVVPAKTKETKAKKAKETKTTARGGSPAPTYDYQGHSGTIREHLLAAIPDLTPDDIARARRNINRRIKGRAGRSTPTMDPGAAIAREIARLKSR